jgi:uncharacterized repeat protein (TIGR01451 family)
MTSLVNGENATWLIRVTNYGPGPTNDTITVVDDLPAGLAFVSSGGDDGIGCTVGIGDVVTCTIGDVLEVGDTRDITLTTTVTAPPGASIVNEATVSGGVTVDGEPLSAEVLADIAEEVTDPTSGLGDVLGIDAPATGIAAQDETPATTILAFTGFDAGHMVKLGLFLLLLGAAVLWLGRKERRTLRA